MFQATGTYSAMAHPPTNASFAQLEDSIKDKIFQYTGRETIFAYQIATGGQENDKPYVMKNALYEPFTYWDWHETDPTFQEYDKRKRRLFWERERGFRANGGPWSSYPSPKRRWEDFKGSLHDETRRYVKRIAVARWMQEEDLKWISEELTALEALDLGDLETREGKLALTHNDGRPRWQAILDILQSSEPRQSNLAEKRPVHILKRLNWLGLANDLRTEEGDDAFSTVLRACEQLQTLSLRAPSGYDADYWSNLHHQDAEDIHHRVCLPILRITKNIPDTVTELELRQCIDFLPFFIDRLNTLKPSIEKVGIDLGAWVQVFPLRGGPKPAKTPIIEDREIEENVQKAANWAAEFSKLHNKTVPVPIPEHSNAEMWGRSVRAGSEIDATARKFKSHFDDEFLDRAYKKKRKSFYRDDGGTNICRGIDRGGSDSALVARGRKSRTFEATNCDLDGASHSRIRGAVNTRSTNTLTRMLKKLFMFRHKTPSVFALDPEPENRSADPIHPLALVQIDDEVDCGAGTKYRDFGPDQDLTDTYRYLNDTFNWRPVFDWDWFMLQDEMSDTVDPAYRRMIDEEKGYMTRIDWQFRCLRNAGIPVHLLIGRRKEGGANCYWGWPYTEQNWEDWLKRDFDANLNNIASLVDSLSIFYDLRNPLDEERLEAIEALQPCRRPPAKCPQVPCPWGADPDSIYGDCPFRYQRRPLCSRRTATMDGKQKMANKQALQTPTGHARLANSEAAAPPVGENASDQESDESEMDGKAQVTPLHELTRTAAYAREAVGWHRFWATYALKFTRLTMLRVRMPKAFDKLDSWRLAQLLDKKAGWEILVFTDERQHVQTAEDLTRSIPGIPLATFEHLPEAKIWPAGRSVRRSWVWPQKRSHFTSGVAEGGKARVIFSTEKTPGWADRKFGLAHVRDTAALEAKAMSKGLKRAKKAAQREVETEAKLSEMRPAGQALDNREKKRLYHHAVRLIAQDKWEAELQRKIDEMQRAMGRGIRDPAQNPQQWIKWLQLRQQEKPPIVNTHRDYDNLAPDSDTDIKGDIGWKDTTLRDASWVPEFWFDHLVPEYGFWETDDVSKEDASLFDHTVGDESDGGKPEEKALEDEINRIVQQEDETPSDANEESEDEESESGIESSEMEGVVSGMGQDTRGLLEVAGDNVVVYAGNTVQSGGDFVAESIDRPSVEVAQQVADLGAGKKRKADDAASTSSSKKIRTSEPSRHDVLTTEAQPRPSLEIQFEQVQQRELEMQLEHLREPVVSPPGPQPEPHEVQESSTGLLTKLGSSNGHEATTPPEPQVEPALQPEVPDVPPPTPEKEQDQEEEEELELEPKDIMSDEKNDSSDIGTGSATKGKGKESGKRASGQQYVPESHSESDDGGDKPTPGRGGRGGRGRGRARGRESKGAARGGRGGKERATAETKPKTERKKREKKAASPAGPTSPVARRTRSKMKQGGG
jgi:hypothetical protein